MKIFNQVIIFLAVLLILVTLYILFMIRMHNMPNEKSHDELKEYLRHVTSLVENYSNLTYSDHLIKDTFITKSEGMVPQKQINEKINTPQAQNIIDSLKKDIVIGMAKDIDPKNFVVFCASLRQVNRITDVVLFVNKPVPSRHNEIAKQHNIQIIEFDLTSLNENIRKYHPSTLRWPLFLKYFQDIRIQGKYGRVWMVDARDTFFQADPFLILSNGSHGFYVFHGVESMTIAQCGWNGGWVKDCFGDAMLDKIGYKHIICSGVSVGDMKSVYTYLEMMTDIVLGKKTSSLAKTSNFPQCERNGVDQGVHNVLVHTNSIPNVKIFDQASGPVLNLQAGRGVIKDMEVYNQLGVLVPVVHQYDRNNALQASLFSKYVDWTNTNDPLAEFKELSQCQGFSVRADTELFKAVCDIGMKGGASSPASCCSHCRSQSGCQGFTFWNGACFLKNCRKGKSAVPQQGAYSAFLT